MQPASARPPRAELIAGGLLLLAMLSMSYGVAWDVQWHTDVGPDTFFTVPHLLIYLGPSLAGFTSLAVVLLRTGARRRGAETPGGGREVTVFGTFHAPLPFLVTGICGAVQLLYGMADLWWHSEYGFDATLQSPPHVGLALGGLGVCAGTIMVFAAGRQHRSYRVGLAVSVALTLVTLVFALFWAKPIEISMVTVDIIGLMVVAGALRRPGWVTVTGLAFLFFLVTQWFFVLWATQSYADALGLAFRDYVSVSPKLPALYPMALPLVAMVLDGTVLVGRRRAVSARALFPLLGAGAAVLLMLGYLWQLGVGPQLWLVALAVPLGLFAGWVGWRLSFPIRRLTPATAPRTLESPVTVPGG